jgi:tRNA nucleotidyltransferase (CCA-adding enzyme)
MQFSSRFNFSVHPETIQLCKELREEFQYLSQDRIGEEWFKWASKSIKPSLGLQFLKDCEWLEFFPEINNLIGVEQSSQYHPEGDVFTHTLHVVDNAALISQREGLSTEQRLVVMFASLCQKEVCISFLNNLRAPNWLIDRVIPLVVNHLRPMHEEPTPKMVRKLSRDMYPSNIQELSWVVEANHNSRRPLEASMPLNMLKVLSIANELDVALEPLKPLVQGRHLINELGMKPSKEFGVILDRVLQAQINGEVTSLEEGLNWLRANRI